MKDIIKRGFLGIAWGCMVFVFISIIKILVSGDTSMISNDAFVRNAIGSMIIGVAFTVPSIVYINNKLSRGMQSFIQIGIGFITYVIIALNLSWIPSSQGSSSLLGGVGVLVLITAVISVGFYLYYRYEAHVINKSIKEKNN